LDELETDETHRIRRPVTVAARIDHWSGFVLDCRVGTLPPRRKPEGSPALLAPRENESR
jgi:hypothetical protein